METTYRANGDTMTELTELVKDRLIKLEKNFEYLESKSNMPGAGSTDNADQSEHRAAFDRYLRKGDDSGLEDLQIKAMNTGSDTDGGYLVLPEMDKTIDRVAQTIGAMYRVANTVTIGTAKYEKLVKTSGMAMRRVADGATGGETTEPKFAKIAIEVFPAEVEPWVYNETLQDSFADLETDLANEAAISFSEGGAVEFITGNGVGCARGILSYTPVANASFAWGSVGYVVSGATASFKTASTTVNSADALIDLVHALKAQYRTGANWLMNNSTAGTVRKLKDADGRHVWVDSLINGQPSMLLGYPVEIEDNMPDVGAGAHAIAFGNFKRAYTIVNRSGTTLIRDPYTSKGQTKFNMRKRFGGGVVNFEAFKTMKFATS